MKKKRAQRRQPRVSQTPDPVVRPCYSAVLAVVMQNDGLTVQQNEGMNFLALREGQDFAAVFKEEAELSSILLHDIKRVVILRSKQGPAYRMSVTQSDCIRKWVEQRGIGALTIAYTHSAFQQLLREMSNSRVKVWFSPVTNVINMTDGHHLLAPPSRCRLPDRTRKVELKAAAAAA